MNLNYMQRVMGIEAVVVYCKTPFGDLPECVKESKKIVSDDSRTRQESDPRTP